VKGVVVISMRHVAHEDPKDQRRSWSTHIPAGPVSALEFLLLGVAAAAVVLLWIPSAFGIESSCVGAAGVLPTSGDTYIAGFVMLGTLGWLGVFLGMLYASIADRNDVVVLLPPVWFLTFVLAALVVAATLGPVPCPA
jgi:hypothetical protein